jgi:hypothetical protein
LAKADIAFQAHPLVNRLNLGLGWRRLPPALADDDAPIVSQLVSLPSYFLAQNSKAFGRV